MLELMISTVALIIMMIVVYYLFGSQVPEGLKTDTQVEQQHDARMAIQLMSRDLRSAQAVEFGASKLAIRSFIGKPNIGLNAGNTAASTQNIEYYLDGSSLYYNNKTTSNKKEIAKNITTFKVFMQEDYVAIKLEAEIEVMFERQTFSKVNTVLFTKVFPRHLYQAKKYPGFFSFIDNNNDF